MFNMELEKQRSQSLFFKALIIVFLIRITFAAWIPITGDEAYFIVWGKNLDYGYYDHTPFVGWLLAALLTVSDAAWWLRLPSVILPIVIAYGIYRILLPRLPQVAAWSALAYLVAPVNLINVLITTDTPLIFFSFVSAWFFYRALYETESNQDFLITGLFLGLAFFSKYFAVLLGISYGLYIILFYRNRRGLSGLGLILLMVLPFVIINILWNYNHCWNNILFNLFNRTVGADKPLVSLGKYIVTLVIIFLPLLIYFTYKNKNILKQQWSIQIIQVYIWLAFLPLILFLLVLIRKEIGLHWLLSFSPFAFIALAGVLNVKQWRLTFNLMWSVSLMLLIALSSLLLISPLTLEAFFNKKEVSQNLIFGKYSEEVLEELKPYEKNYILATISYGWSSTVSYRARKHVIVFDKASFHAREDERLTNYKELNGKNILIFKRTAANLDKLGKYFTFSERKTFKVREATFELLIGNGFNYKLYREEVLKEVNRDFYAIPDWLPVGQCEFKSKYGFNER